MRKLAVALAALLGAGSFLVLVPASDAHEGGSFCESSFEHEPFGPVRPDGTQLGHSEGRCETSFQGFPAGVIGVYSAGDPTAPAAIHVEAHAVLANGTRYKLAECELSGTTGVAECALETSTPAGPLALPEALPQEIVAVECLSHSHANVKVGTAPVARFGCYTTDASEAELREDMGLAPSEEPPGGGTPSVPGAPTLPTGAGAVITAVPKDTYAPNTVAVTRAGDVTFANFDANRHDVVARVYDGTRLRADHVRPDGSAPWCDDFAGDCPLFWSELISGPGATTSVLGLEDATVGASYEFFCSIHPSMRGTIQVVG